MFSRYSVSPKAHHELQGGFSLVELMVSIGIVVLVLTIVVTRQSSFNGAVLLRSQAYEMALAIREIQLSAVSSQSNEIGEFYSVLGVHVDTDDEQNNRYVLFSDSNGNDFFDGSATDQLLSSTQLDSRFEIAAVRRSDGFTLGSGNDISITFERPNFDARFKTDSTGGFDTLVSVQIDIRPVGVTGTSCPAEVRTIEITSTGQVAVVEC